MGPLLQDDLSDSDSDVEGYYDKPIVTDQSATGGGNQANGSRTDAIAKPAEARSEQPPPRKATNGSKPLSETMKIWIASEDSHERLITDLTSPTFPTKSNGNGANGSSKKAH